MTNLIWIVIGLLLWLAGGRTRKVNKDADKAFKKCAGFNMERQRYLESLAFNSKLKRNNEFEKILGHEIYASKNCYETDIDGAVREIAKREGWRYYNVAEVMNDPEYAKFVGINPPTFPRKSILSPKEMEEAKIEAKNIRNERLVADWTETAIMVAIGLVIWYGIKGLIWLLGS